MRHWTNQFCLQHCRFFEAERRVLVLDTVIDHGPTDGHLHRSRSTKPAAASADADGDIEALSVTIICPTAKHLESIRRHCNCGLLREDLEERLLTSDLMDELTTALVDAVRLDVQLDEDDVDMAQYELN